MLGLFPFIDAAAELCAIGDDLQEICDRYLKGRVSITIFALVCSPIIAIIANIWPIITPDARRELHPADPQSS